MLRESLWGHSGLHIEQVVVELREDVSVAGVREAWLQTVAATEVLRGRFRIEDGEAVGFLREAGIGEWRESSVEPPNWSDWLEEDRRTPLPLVLGVPWRVVFWPERRRWVWTFHHALLDGRSITRIVQAFLKRLTGEEPGPLALPCRSTPDETAVARAVAFHQGQAAEACPWMPVFPGDGKFPATVRRELGADMAERLGLTAERLQVSAPTLLIWAWSQTLAVAAGADCAALGQVRAGAPQADCAGFSMQTLPLVVPRAREGSLAAHVNALGAKLLAMRAYEQVPTESLPDLFPGSPGDPWPCGGLMVETGTIHHRVGDFPQVHSVRLHESGAGGLFASAYIRPDLRLEVECDGVTIGPVGAQSLLAHWALVVSRLADGPEGVEDASTLTEIGPPLDGVTFLEDGGEPITEESITQLWAKAVSRFGDLPALETGSRSISYQLLDAGARDLASRLVAEGVTAGVHVASFLEDRAHLPVVMLALAMVGGVHVPLDPALPEQRRRSILEDSAARFLISLGPIPESPDIILISPEASAAVAGVTAPNHAMPDELLALLYTSGSTGIPKGVLLSHGGVANEAVAMAGLLELGPGDRVLQFASPGFDAALEEIFATLASGATLVPRSKEIAEDLEVFHHFLGSAGITVLDLTTAYWAIWCAWMTEGNQRIPPGIRAVVVGGERLSAAAVADWERAGGGRIPLINSYGPTEASIVATAEILTGLNEKADPPIGRPLPGVIARVADAEGARIPEGAAGELWLGGYGVSPGYWKRAERTAARFVAIEEKRFYRTGDRVYRDATGRLRFLGRIDNQLKIRGHRVEPEEVKQAAESYPGVGSCHADMVDGHLSAWVKWTGIPPVGWPALLAQHLSKILPSAAVPVRWAEVDAFSLTERGKLDTTKLPLPLLTTRGSLDHEAPETVEEKRLAEIWRELLGLREIGRDDSFFDLGGNSLAALRLFAILSREWQVRVPMAALIQAPTLRTLAGFLQQATNECRSKSSREPLVVAIRAEGTLSPLFCIHGGDGGVIFYRNLSNHLPAGRPVLAIESPALGAEEEARVVSVEESAADYVRTLRKHQPHGPYHLAGYSYGGLLVYEMAAQLVAANEEAVFVGLFDTVNPAAQVRRYSLMERAEVYWNSNQRLHWFDRIFRLAGRVREGIATHLRVRTEIRAAKRPGKTEPHSEIRMLHVREAHWTAMKNYRPSKLACHVTLFRTKAADDKFEIPPDYGWTGLVKSLEVVEVEGRHLTMFEPDHAAALAGKVAARI